MCVLLNFYWYVPLKNPNPRIQMVLEFFSTAICYSNKISVWCVEKEKKVPYQPHWKIAKMALFNPCMEFQIFLGQMSSFDALWKCHLVIFSQKCPKLRPCAF